MQQNIAQIAVIGGGASGLAAAIEAKQYGGSECRVVIIEKNSRLGKKILATGNGRCNLGNIEEKQRRHYSGSCAELAEELFSDYEGSEAFFKSLGVICKADSGRLYPYSNHAASVLDALRFQVQELQIDVITDTSVKSVISESGFWKLSSDSCEIFAEKVIIACGGKAAPAMGTDGSFYKIIEKMGHRLTPIAPALCPVYTKPSLLHGLKGIRALAKASLYNENGELAASDAGEVQLTDKSLSGICIFNLASFAQYDNMYISLDLLPHLKDYEVRELLWDIYAQRAGWNIEDMMSGIFNKKMCPAILKASGVSADFSAPVYALTPDDMERIAVTIKDWRFPVIGIAEWENAQVTSGGIHRNEITDKLESTISKGVYFSGEILDIAGECGGYNLAWAWCSGITAARAAVDSLKGCDI